MQSKDHKLGVTWQVFLIARTNKFEFSTNFWKKLQKIYEITW
jgi:hypothetical protein